MKGPIELVRSGTFNGYRNLGPFYEWSEGKAYLVIDRIAFGDSEGAVLCYCNPPVHQVGNPGLDAYLEGLALVSEKSKDLSFLVLYGSNDPVHAGGDLKESLTRLDQTLEARKEKEAFNASSEEIDRLFDWADKRISKGVALHGAVRDLARNLRVVAVCGGGMRYGGSAEIPLMADYLVGDSRSGMCFSESMIGLIPGWGGVARALVKAGPMNAAFMAKTAKETKARDLLRMGIYNVVVDVPFSFPRKERTDDPEADKARYLDALAEHDHETGLLVLPEGLRIATCPEEEIPLVRPEDRPAPPPEEEISRETARRMEPENYAGLRGRPLKEVRDEIGRLGRPLAPQSIEALDKLLGGVSAESLDEKAFVRREGEMDSRLYRDPRFRSGLIATLGQKVADYRM
ncbi:MAG: enoyl-CoA hydratase-related protein [Thermodesulfobacteriota bacterium]